MRVNFEISCFSGTFSVSSIISVLNHVLQWSLKPRYLIDMIQRCTSYICIVGFFWWWGVGRAWYKNKVAPVGGSRKET